MSDVIRWLVFDPADRLPTAEVVLLDDEMAREIRRLAYGRQVCVEGEVVHFLTNGNRAAQYVRLEPSTDRGRAERDAQLGPELVAKFVTPPRPVAPMVARLRQLADTLAGLELPDYEYASVQLVFEDVTALDAVSFATALIQRAQGSYMETTPSTVAVHAPDRDAEWCIELAFPEAPAGAPADTTDLEELGAS